MRAVLLVSFIVVVLLPASVQSRQVRDHAGSLLLVPTPKMMEPSAGAFTFAPGLGIEVRNPDDGFARAAVQAELKNAMGISIDARRPARGQARVKTVSFVRLTNGAAILKDLAAASRRLVDSLGAEGYIVHITPAKIVVAANTGAGVFYGAQTLKQLIRSNATGSSIPCGTIVDWPGLRYRGVMLDISRGPIPTMEYLKEIIATLAEYKQNAVTLYTEHVFRLRSHPDVAPADGITPAQVKELSSFARMHHIELIGNSQPFGHMEHTLAIPFYRPLAENPWVISPAIEASYGYLRDVFAEIVPSYESPLFHINSDEVSGLGEGPARRMVDSMGVGGVYAYHINRINDLMKPYGKRLMMWGDIAVNNPQIIDRLPKDLIIVSWGYHVADSFDDAILPFAKTGFDFLVAPGVSCWGNVWPNMSVATVNISNYVRDGAALGTMGMLNTVWVDDGENLGAYNWHGLLWGAECSWTPARRLTGEEARNDLASRSQRFDRAFDALFFGTPDVAATLYLFDSLRALPVRGIVTDGAVWSGMLDVPPEETGSEAVGANDRVVRDAAALRSRLEHLKQTARWHHEVLDAALFAADRVGFTAVKNIVRAALAKTIHAPTGPAVSQTRGFLKALFEQLHGLKKTYATLWDRENRGWWRDRVLGRYDKLGAELLDVDKVVLIDKDTATTGGTVRIRCHTPFDDHEIHVTTDGSEPTLRSPVYRGPIVLERSTLIRARVFAGARPGPLSEKNFLVHTAFGCPVKLFSTYSSYDPAYAAGGHQALTDGLRGSDNFKDGRWQGYQGQDIIAVIDLQKPADLHRISIGLLQSSYSWILMPSKVEYWASLDGREYTLVREVQTGVDPRADGTVVRDVAGDLTGVRARFVRVIAKNPGPLPAWHHSAGQESFMFADEIVVE